MDNFGQTLTGQLGQVGPLKIILAKKSITHVTNQFKQRNVILLFLYAHTEYHIRQYTIGFVQYYVTATNKKNPSK